MPRISHGFASTAFETAYLGLGTNLMLAVACLPLLVLAIGTNPVESWPYLAIAAALAAPGFSAAFTVFREHGHGDTRPVRTFLRGYAATWRKALTVGAVTAALLVVLLVDVRALAASTLGVVVVPLLLLLSVLTLAAGMLSLVAIAEVPVARLRDVLRAALLLGVRRWYLTLVSLLVGAVQVALFANLPAIAAGVTAAAALFLIWANSRFTLRPVLPAAEPLTD
ncbi:DUF624 domain-containing protein [Leifsonia sp. NPDC058230]|uniref:DUF624 domain-containing protein n=1 Tax=Leifsonia sp. NPDC058230 TaxID=3346391 RepID=UPI0036DC012E